MAIMIKSAAEIEVMRRAGRIAARAMSRLAELIAAGMTTLEVDRIIEEEIRNAGAIPSFKGLYGFPASACVSLNDQVVHGIPSSQTKIREGDIVSVDIGATLEGFCSDMTVTFAIGNVLPEVAKLVKVTEESLHVGIEQARPGNRLGDIGHAIQAHAEAAGLGVVRDYVGHGIGRKMHEDPQIPNFGPPHQGVSLREGMVLAIEPMINLGTWEVRQMDDGWTVKTLDHKPSAHFEHTVAVTANGPEILTRVE
jgi:methionyl aminopeptidase